MLIKKPNAKKGQDNDQASPIAEQTAESNLHAEVDAPTVEVAQSNEALEAKTESGGEQKLKAGDIVDSELILFTSPTCGPCKQIKPVLTDLAKANDLPLEIVSFDPETNQHLFEKFGIRNVPALIRVDFVVQDDGKVIEQIGDRIVGYKGEGHLTALLKEWGLLSK